MTPAELRSLAAKGGHALPPREGSYTPDVEEAADWLCDHSAQLALLCAELSDALELLWVHYLLPMSIEQREQIVAALASLEALEKPQ